MSRALKSDPVAAIGSAPLDAAGISATVFCCVLWAGNTVAVKYTVPDLPPFGSAGLRFVLGLPVIAAACFHLGHGLRVPIKHAWLIVIHTILTVLQIGTFTWGTSHGMAGRSSILVNVHPLVVAPLAWIFLGERMGRAGIAGLFAATLGIVALMSNPVRGEPTWAGDIVVLLSGIILGVQTIAQKKTFHLIPPTTLLFAQTLFSIPLFFLQSALVEGIDTYRFTERSCWGVLYQGVLVSGVCFTIWLVLLRRYPAARLSTVAFLTPIFGVALASLIRGESLTIPLLAGGSLVGLGIYLVAADRAAHVVKPEPELPGEDAP